MRLNGFDWDDGNWPKCGKHGVTKAEIEQAVRNQPAVSDDPHPGEPRSRAIGRTDAGRYIFVVFVLRQFDGSLLFRPISARFMHQKEIDHYEKQR